LDAGSIQPLQAPLGDAAPADLPDPLIAAEGLGIRRSGRWLIRGIDLQVGRREIVSLIGPNGGGKSTTAKALLGIHAADEGRIRRAPGLRTGYVPQRLAIDWTMPLNVRRLMTLTGRFTAAEIDAALDGVGISHLAAAEVQTLSGGEFQRAMLARALIRNPDLLVLDEPVQGVDFGGEIALYELIAAIRDRLSCGILLISHDLHVVMGRTDRVICLNGHVCCSGSPQSVTSNPEYHRLFGPRAAEALGVYRHRHDHTHLTDGRVVPLDGATGGKTAHRHDA